MLDFQTPTPPLCDLRSADAASGVSHSDAERHSARCSFVVRGGWRSLRERSVPAQRLVAAIWRARSHLAARQARRASGCAASVRRGSAAARGRLRRRAEQTHVRRDRVARGRRLLDQDDTGGVTRFSRCLRPSSKPVYRRARAAGLDRGEHGCHEDSRRRRLARHPRGPRDRPGCKGKRLGQKLRVSCRSRKLGGNCFSMPISSAGLTPRSEWWSATGALDLGKRRACSSPMPRRFSIGITSARTCTSPRRNCMAETPTRAALGPKESWTIVGRPRCGGPAKNPSVARRAGSPAKRKALRELHGYLQNNASRMRYPSIGRRLAGWQRIIESH